MRTLVLNKRELPSDIPPMDWDDRVKTWEARPEALAGVYHSLLEYLTPSEANRLRAQMVVWVEETGEAPNDVNTWWPVRMARRRGDVPHTNEVVIGTVDGEGVMHCGNCGARWSDRPERCKLCDRLLMEVKCG